MKDGFDVASDVRSLINVPRLTTTIDGKIYLKVRPDSELTDIVVSAMTVSNEQTQKCIVNIRIYTKDISTTITMGNQTKALPNQAEFNRISKIICSLIDTQYRDTFWTEIRSSPILFQLNDGTHACVIKLNYYSIQNDFRNI